MQRKLLAQILGTQTALKIVVFKFALIRLLIFSFVYLITSNYVIKYQPQNLQKSRVLGIACFRMDVTINTLRTSCCG